MVVMDLAARIAALADELEADPGYGGRYDASMSCADRLREILAETDDDVWTLSYAEYDNSSTVAVFATQEIAEQHAADRDEDLGLACHPLLNRRPEKLTLEYRTASVNDDGRVERYNEGKQPQEYWDYEAPEPLQVNRYQRATRVSVHAEPGAAKAVLLEQVDLVLDGYAAEGSWTETMLTAAKMQARWDRPPTPVSRCYRTASGLAVHVRSGCAC